MCTIYCMCLSLSIEPLLTLPFTLEGDRWWIARAFDSSSVQQELHWPSCKPLSYIFLSALYSYGRCSLLLVCVLAIASTASTLCRGININLTHSVYFTPTAFSISKQWSYFIFIFVSINLFFFSFHFFVCWFVCSIFRISLVFLKHLLLFLFVCFFLLHAACLFLHTDAYDGSKRLLGRFILSVLVFNRCKSAKLICFSFVTYVNFWSSNNARLYRINLNVAHKKLCIIELFVEVLISFT